MNLRSSISAGEIGKQGRWRPGACGGVGVTPAWIYPAGVPNCRGATARCARSRSPNTQSTPPSTTRRWHVRVVLDGVEVGIAAPRGVLASPIVRQEGAIQDTASGLNDGNRRALRARPRVLADSTATSPLKSALPSTPPSSTTLASEAAETAVCAAAAVAVARSPRRDGGAGKGWDVARPAGDCPGGMVACKACPQAPLSSQLWAHNDTVDAVRVEADVWRGLPVPIGGRYRARWCV
jgi:hypothetical protein